MYLFYLLKNRKILKFRTLITNDVVDFTVTLNDLKIHGWETET